MSALGVNLVKTKYHCRISHHCFWQCKSFLRRWQLSAMLAHHLGPGTASHERGSGAEWFEGLMQRAVSLQVVPSDVGNCSPPWFLFTRAYWWQQKLDYVDEKLLARLLAAGEQQVWLPPRRPFFFHCVSRDAHLSELERARDLRSVWVCKGICGHSLANNLPCS